MTISHALIINVCLLEGTTKNISELLFFSSGKRIETDVFQVNSTNPEFEVNDKDGKFIVNETTNFLFRGITGNILRALLITLFLELLVAIYIFRGRFNRRLALFISIVNCISLPVAWLLFDYIIEIYTSPLYLMLSLEITIGIFEYFALKSLLKDECSAYVVSTYVIAANLISFLLGGILYLITTFL